VHVSTARPESIDDAFYALIAADPDLLRAEFDELIDSVWGPPPEPPSDDRTRSHQVRPRASRSPLRRDRLPESGVSAQERSPPH
jgi:hypothetical protein